MKWVKSIHKASPVFMCTPITYTLYFCIFIPTRHLFYNYSIMHKIHFHTSIFYRGIFTHIFTSANIPSLLSAIFHASMLHHNWNYPFNLPPKAYKLAKPLSNHFIRIDNITMSTILITIVPTLFIACELQKSSRRPSEV